MITSKGDEMSTYPHAWDGPFTVCPSGLKKKTGASGFVMLDGSAKKEKNSSWWLLASFWFTYFLPGLCLAQGDKTTSRYFQTIDGKERMISIPQPLQTDAEIVILLAIFISYLAFEIFFSGTISAFPDWLGISRLSKRRFRWDCTRCIITYKSIPVVMTPVILIRL